MEGSKLTVKYNKAVDSESAYEILTEKLEEAAEKTTKEAVKKHLKEGKSAAKKEESFFDNPIVKSAGRTAANIITEKNLLGALGLGGRTRKSKSWFQ